MKTMTRKMIQPSGAAKTRLRGGKDKDCVFEPKNRNSRMLPIKKRARSGRVITITGEGEGGVGFLSRPNEEKVLQATRACEQGENITKKAKAMGRERKYQSDADVGFCCLSNSG